MSPQVWSPGQVTWPNLQQIMRSCHCYSGGEKDVNLSWFGTPITYKFMSVLYHWPWVRSFSWPYIISQSGKLKYLQIHIRSVQIVQDHTQLGYCWLPRCNFSCANLERSFEVIWHHEVYTLQGVLKLMAPSIACNNKKTRRDWFIVSLLMNSPHFSIQGPKRSGIPHIALSNISAEKQHPGRPGVCDESGFWRRRVHLVDLIPDDRPEVFDGRQV